MSNLLFSIPNGSNKNPRQANLFKRTGLTSGVADLMLAVPKQGYHGMFIEMKSEEGVLSKNQKVWSEEIINQGYYFVVCRSLTSFVLEITNYLVR